MADYTVQDLQDNLNYLNETKSQIKQAIINFYEYQKIGNAGGAYRLYKKLLDKGIDLAKEEEYIIAKYFICL